MLCINQLTSADSQANRVSPNILPCEIAYTGSIQAPKRFWNPQLTVHNGEGHAVAMVDDAAQKQNDIPEQVPVAYFRGRRLLGITSALPAGYQGVIVSGEKSAVARAEPEPQSQSQSHSHSQHGTAFSRMLARRDHDDRDDGYDDDDDNREEDSLSDAAGEDGAEDEIPLESTRQLSTFQDVTVWEHDVLPTSNDSFIRGIEEWLTFAQVVHGSPASGL